MVGYLLRVAYLLLWRRRVSDSLASDKNRNRICYRGSDTRTVAQKKILISNDNYTIVSASFGIASMSANEEIKETIKHADQALYLAKKNGRNRRNVEKK